MCRLSQSRLKKLLMLPQQQQLALEAAASYNKEEMAATEVLFELTSTVTLNGAPLIVAAGIIEAKSGLQMQRLMNNSSCC